MTSIAEQPANIDTITSLFNIPSIHNQLTNLAQTLVLNSEPCKATSFSQCRNQSTKIFFIRTAVQFADEMLHYSSDFINCLTQFHQESQQAQLWSIDAFVLADTQYSSCCADEVAAKHLDAHVIVHVGRSCLSGTSHLPVIYAFGRLPINAGHAADSLCSLLGKSHGHEVLVIYDTTYDHAMDAIQHHIEQRKLLDRFIFADLVPKTDPEMGGVHYSRHVPDSNQLSPESTTVVIVGQEGPLVAHYGLLYNQYKVFHYNPVYQTLDELKSLYMKRYALMLKARDANVIGIVIGTLGVENYIETISTIKRMITAYHKKYYVFVLGKLNVAKLANFADIDVFVLVACPESSLIDSKEFYKPVVTPFELAMALDVDSKWTGAYKLRFSDLATHMHTTTQNAETTDGSEKDPYFSLASGKLNSQHVAYNNTEIHSKIQTLALSDAGALTSPASQKLMSRKWHGLETGRPKHELCMEVVQGRFGNAAQYHGES